MGMVKTSAPHFSNLPDTLSNLAALLIPYDFKRFRMAFASTAWNVSSL